VFARVTTIQIQSGKQDEVANVTQASIVPSVKMQRGYRGFYSLIDRRTGKGQLISLWDNEGIAIVNEQSGYYQAQIAKLTPFLTEKPVRDGYDVAAQG
jgi:hypothetical protein